LRWERKHSERAIWVLEERVLEIIIESERGSKIDEVKPSEEESWGEAAESEPEGTAPLPRGVSEEGVEAEGDDGTGGDIIGDDGEGDGETSEEGVGCFGAQEIETGDEESGGEIVIEKDRAEGEESGGESEGESGEECGKFLSIGEVDSDPEKENATGGGEDADAENGGEPEV
jgi:hypothetical protein